jgi:hypothetical protein
MLADRSFAPSVYDSVIDLNCKAAVDLINDLNGELVYILYVWILSVKSKSVPD